MTGETANQSVQSSDGREGSRVRHGRSSPRRGAGAGGAEGGKAPPSRGKEPLPAGKEPPYPGCAMEDVLPSGLLEICLLVGASTERVRALLQVSGVRAGGASAWGWVCQRVELKCPNRKLF